MDVKGNMYWYLAPERVGSELQGFCFMNRQR